jgi:hypothetical protein
MSRDKKKFYLDGWGTGTIEVNITFEPSSGVRYAIEAWDITSNSEGEPKEIVVLQRYERYCEASMAFRSMKKLLQMVI